MSQSHAPESYLIADHSSFSMHRTDSNDSFDSTNPAPTLEEIGSKHEFDQDDYSNALIFHETNSADTNFCFGPLEVTGQHIWTNDKTDDIVGAGSHSDNGQTIAEHIYYNGVPSSQEAGLHFDNGRYFSTDTYFNSGSGFDATGSHLENGQSLAGTSVPQPSINTYTFGNPSTGEVAIITCPGDVVVESWSFGGSLFKFKNKDSRPAFEKYGAA
ncbi:hypothetical protein V8E51_001151 [Hyaloscypha variabilis]